MKKSNILSHIQLTLLCLCLLGFLAPQAFSFVDFDDDDENQSPFIPFEEIQTIEVNNEDFVHFLKCYEDPENKNPKVAYDISPSCLLFQKLHSNDGTFDKEERAFSEKFGNDDVIKDINPLHAEVIYTENNRYIYKTLIDKKLELKTIHTVSDNEIITFIKLFPSGGKVAFIIANSGKQSLIIRSIHNTDDNLKDVILSLDENRIAFTLSISPNGKKIAWAEQDLEGIKTYIKIIDVETKKTSEIFVGKSVNISSMVFTPDEKKLITGSNEPKIKIWSLIDNKLLKILPGHGQTVTSLAVSPVDDILVSGGEDKALIIYNISTGKILQIIKDAHLGTIRHIDFAIGKNDTIFEKGKPLTSFITAGADGIIRVWGHQKNKFLQ